MEDVTKHYKTPTSEDVARLANVSRATVSTYINQTGNVSKKSQKKIEEAIEILNYIPNEVARSLKTKNNNAIGFIVPVMSKFYLPMIRSINEMIYQKGYTMLLGSSEEYADRERDLLKMFVANKVKGILVVPCTNKNFKIFSNAQEHGIVCIQLNRRIENLETDSVVSNIRQAIFDAVDFLYNARNKRKIALIGYDPNIITNNDKLEGYERAVENTVWTGLSLRRTITVIRESTLR